MNGATRYRRRLVVVVALVAAVIGLGFLWRSSPAANLVADDRTGRAEPAAPTGPLRGDAQFRSQNGGGFSLANISDLGQTVVIGVGVLGAVVVVDRFRRHRKPIRP